jgi:hypothetical protein
MIRTPAGFFNETRIKRFQDFPDLGYGVTVLTPDLFGTGTPAGNLLGAEPLGLAIDYTVTPAQMLNRTASSSYLGPPFIGDGGILTFSRASPATIINSTGLVETVTNNVPRIDYSPSGILLGLLIEEQRTNLALWSSDLTNVIWTATNVNAVKTATGPDGVVNSATTLTATSSDGTVLQAITSASAARITSCYIKRRTGTGVVQLTQNNGTTWTDVTVTNDWTRVNIASATAANPTIGIRIRTSGDAVDVALFQHELGTFITSAIPTTSGSVIRSPDVISAATTTFSYSASEGTFVVAYNFVGFNSSDIIAAVSDNTSSNMIELHLASLTSANFRVRNGGSNQAAIPTSVAVNVLNKTGGAYKVNNFASSSNGGNAVLDTAGTIPTVNKLTLGFRASAFYLNGHIQQFTYLPRRISNAELKMRTG